MAFNADDRVRVTSQASEFRKKLGTVVTAAADADDGLNKVRIDGHRDDKLTSFSDGELGTTGTPSPIQYA